MKKRTINDIKLIIFIDFILLVLIVFYFVERIMTISKKKILSLQIGSCAQILTTYIHVCLGAGSRVWLNVFEGHIPFPAVHLVIAFCLQQHNFSMTEAI